MNPIYEAYLLLGELRSGLVGVLLRTFNVSLEVGQGKDRGSFLGISSDNLKANVFGRAKAIILTFRLPSNLHIVIQQCFFGVLQVPLQGDNAFLDRTRSHKFSYVVVPSSEGFMK